MKTKEEKLIDAIGDTNDSNVLAAVGQESADFALNAGARHIELAEAPKISETDVKKYRIRNGIFGGLAAALVITGGVVVWNRVGGLHDPFSDPSQTTTISDPNSVVADESSDIRGLKWGMTLEEVKAHETETLSSVEEDDELDDHPQTLLIYNDVKYMNFSTEMTLCVEETDGLSGVNYRLDAATYPDCFNELKEVLTAEYGEYKDNYGSLEWSLPDRNLTVVLFDWTTTVQVGFYPYYDISDIDESDENTVPYPDDPDLSEFTDDNEMDISTYKELDDVALDIYSSELPKTYAEYQTTELPDWFDWNEFSRNGYPRVKLKCVTSLDTDGNYDVYLLADTVYADEDNDNIIYGNLELGVAEHGSDKLFSIYHSIDGDHGLLMIIDLNKLDEYLQVFGVQDAHSDPGENRTIIKTGYGERDSEYQTTFYQIKDGSLSPIYNIAGYVDSDPSVSDNSAMGMRLSSELVKNGNGILDERNGMSFSFDCENDMVSIRAYTGTDDGSDEDDTQSANGETVVKVRTFDIDTHTYYSHEINYPDDHSLFDADMLVGDHTAFICMDRWLDASSLLTEAKRSLGENYESFEAALKPYCNENGGLIYEKAEAVTEFPLAPVLFGNEEYYHGSFEYRILNDDWLISFKNEDVCIYMKNDKLTSIRRAAEYLWGEFAEYPDMAVTAIYDFDTKEAYLLVVSYEDGLKAAMQRDCEKDVFDSCKFVTSEEARAEWLPLTMLADDGEPYIEYVENYDNYYVAFGDVVYKGTQWGSVNDVRDRLKELGQPDKARTLMKEAKALPSTVKSKKELAEALRENIKSFDQLTPYASIFDPVKLPRYYDNGGFSFWYSIGSLVLEVNAFPRNADWTDDYEIHYRLLQSNYDLRRTRYIVTSLRDNYTLNSPENGYVIRGIEVITTYEGSETKRQVRLIADEDMWDKIDRVNGEGMHLMPDDLLYASEPTDTSGLEAYDN